MADLTKCTIVDEIEFEKLILSKTNSLLKYCYGLLCNHADAEDAVQITFIKLYGNRNKIDPNKSLNTYLFKIAYTTSIDILRKKKKIFLLGEGLEDETYIEEAYDSEFPEGLKEILLNLEPVDRGLIVNRVVHEMNYKELAQLYGKPESYLRKRYERARKKMSSLVSEEKPVSGKKGV